MKKQVCMMMAVMAAAVALTGCSGGTKETAAATEAETTQATVTAAETSRDFCREVTAARAGESQRFWLRRRPNRTPMRMN